MVVIKFKIGAKIQRFEDKLRSPEKALKQIGALMVSESQQSFQLQKFGDEEWAPRKVPNVFGIISDFAASKPAPPNRRFHPRPALTDTGRLSQSIAFKVSGDTVVVGSNLPYAAVHQFGGPIESETITEKVQDLLGKWLEKKGKKWASELGFLLKPEMTGKTLKGKVTARPFVGITKQTLEDVHEVVRVTILEVK